MAISMMILVFGLTSVMLSVSLASRQLVKKQTQTLVEEAEIDAVGENFIAAYKAYLTLRNNALADYLTTPGNSEEDFQYTAFDESPDGETPSLASKFISAHPNTQLSRFWDSEKQLTGYRLIVKQSYTENGLKLTVEIALDGTVTRYSKY